MSGTSLIAAHARDPYHLQKLFHPYHLERARALLDGEIPAPSTIEIDLTDGACNQACVHCCFGSGPHRALRSIDPDRLIPFIETAYAHGTRAIELVGGGEPTNHPRISEIIEHIHDIGVEGGEKAHIGLVSNGVRLTRILAVAHHLEWVRISLDAPDEVTYCELHGVCAAQGHYSKVLSNISALGERVDMTRMRLAYLVSRGSADQTTSATRSSRQRTSPRRTASSTSSSVRRWSATRRDARTGGSRRWRSARPSSVMDRTSSLVARRVVGSGAWPARAAEWPVSHAAARHGDQGRRSCPTVCKHFRADAALDKLEGATANGGAAPAIVGDLIDNPHFI